MAVLSDTLFGMVTLIVWSGLIVIDRCLDLLEGVKRTGPRDGMWRRVGLWLLLFLGIGVVYRGMEDWAIVSKENIVRLVGGG